MILSRLWRTDDCMEIVPDCVPWG